MLVGRARLYALIREFFDERSVLEVETPLLCQRTVTDPMLDPFVCFYDAAGHAAKLPLYLQTSPEFAMKRLLASGVGSIFQITKAFRNGEVGRHHNPEFTLLEWYRVGFDLETLQNEVEALFCRVAGAFEFQFAVERTTYCEIFEKYLGLHPLESSIDAMRQRAEGEGLTDAEAICGANRVHWLDFLFSCLIQPKLPPECLTMVSRYPELLPSLARKAQDDARWVERVELFLGGMELGNGFHELTDPCEQEQRFIKDLEVRKLEGLTMQAMDERLIEALRLGLPDCSGIAVGLDRLLMVMTRSSRIEDVLAFPFLRA
ncbi:MAG: hypothetical protein RLZZ627_1964 [Pseudomonadota bacterium]|jgi:lysyl-tRNA synthetase class 2